MNKPERWVVVKISTPKHGTVYKVFGMWYGGYLDGDSWRLNSGIKEVVEEEEFFDFIGYSGSVYRCGKGNYGIGSSYHQATINDLVSQASNIGGMIEVMQENTDWKNLPQSEVK